MEPNRMRKIEVQSPDDIRFILENLSRAAREKIGQNLPPSSTTNNTSASTSTSTSTDADDQLRKRVEEMVMEYVRKTITLALPSISVNGLDAPSLQELSRPTEEFEAYDRKLHDRVSSLHAELEHETLRVAQLRREAPARAGRACEEALRRELEGDERILRELGRSAEDKGAGLGVRELERGEEVRRGYEEGVRILMGLQKTLPATAHKLTRAQDALDYVESKKTAKS